jgi:hypothetical protein
MRALTSLLAALLVVVLFSLSPRGAWAADRELIVPFHERGHLVLDQLSGLRVNAVSGASYAGPAGVSFRSEKVDGLAELKTTSFWFAPSADVFVTDHLSVGGLVEVSHTFGTVDAAGRKAELPATTSMTFVPRVGFYAPFTDRIGLWPRVGFGWTSSESVSFGGGSGTASRASFKSMVLDVDLALVYRFSEAFFLKTGPQVGVTLGGQAGATDASVVQISGVVGFGVNLEL